MEEKQKVFKNIISELKSQNDNETQQKIVDTLYENYNIPQSITLSFMARPLNNTFFNEVDIRIITLFIIESLKILNREDYIESVVSKGEELEAKQFDILAYTNQNKVTLPYDFQPTILVNNVYSTKMSVKEISDFINAGIINYNFDIQREAKLEIRTDKVIKKPTLNRKNIAEMEQLLLSDNLKESTLYFNAAPLSSKEGDELIYNENDYTLRVTEGTRIDVLDGFHRVLAAQNAIRSNPFLKFEFNVIFSNFTTSEAIQWQAQHSKATSWSKNRVTELQQESKGAKVAKTIKSMDFELENLIQSNKVLNSSTGIVSFNELTEYINELFEIRTRRDEVELAHNLSKVLLSYNDVKKINKTFNTQFYVYGLLKIYSEDYKSNTDEYLNLIDKLYKYLSENKEDLSVKTNYSKSKIKKMVYEKLKEVFKKVG